MNPKTTQHIAARYLILLLFMFTGVKVFSQEQNIAVVTNVTKLTILNPGISQELAIGKKQTIYGQLFMNSSASTTDVAYSNPRDIQIDFYFDPALTVQLRHYYNWEKRDRKGRRTEMNSMNYIAAIGETFISKIPLNGGGMQEDRRPVTTLGAAWGLQRNYKGRFSIDFYVGAGYQFAKSTVYTIPQPTTSFVTELNFISQLNIGIWLNKRK